MFRFLYKVDIYCFLFVKVHDIAFTRAGSGRDLFASVGSDGSVRLFDLRLVVCI